MGPSTILIFFEKRREFGLASETLLRELREELSLDHLRSVRLWTGYALQPSLIDSDVSIRRKAEEVLGDPATYHPPLSDSDIQRLLSFSHATGEDPPASKEASELWALPITLLPAQFDHRGDSAKAILELSGSPVQDVRSLQLYLFEGGEGGLTERDRSIIRKRLINPVDSTEPDLRSFSAAVKELLEGFTRLTEGELTRLKEREELGLELPDLLFVRDWFNHEIGRDPGRGELAILATYWSDHCRHTTFTTRLVDLQVEHSPLFSGLEKTLSWYQHTLEKRGICDKGSLMDLALIGAKDLASRGLIPDLDRSEEINAASIQVTASFSGGREPEEWLLLFKNETHNHPTEIEPFGGASTCIGGAIRDPLSGRAYVHQAMRLSGAAYPSAVLESAEPEVLKNAKLSRSTIAREAARGYSSYGNQIGVATGFVREVYDEGFRAKRFEAGAVIGAVPKRLVRRETPREGDLVILLGGATGRDGIGGATGSSRSHDQHSVNRSAAEVQKGNAPEERALQRLFRRGEFSLLIKRCNDFGAGGVAVAVGELAPGLQIDLDAVPLKYRGLSSIQISLSESQERMAVVVDASDAGKMISLAAEEDVAAVVIARITGKAQLEIHHEGEMVASLPRALLDSAGASRKADVQIHAPEESNFFKDLGRKRWRLKPDNPWAALLGELNVSGSEGLTELFDSTVGGRSVLLPLGGRFQTSPEDGMAALLPAAGDDTETASVMSCGYTPELGRWSPYHGALYSVIEAYSRAVSTGLAPDSVRLSLQEYFPPPGEDPEKWGAPVAALLGALRAELSLKIPAIGGKDSMSGRWMELEVPPVLAAFAAGAAPAAKISPSCFSSPGSQIYLLYTPLLKNLEPDFAPLKENCRLLSKLQEGCLQEGQEIHQDSQRDSRTGPGPQSKELLSCRAIGYGGIAQAIAEASFGNRIGFCGSLGEDDKSMPGGETSPDPLSPLYGSFLLEWNGKERPADSKQLILLGATVETEQLSLTTREGELSISLQEALAAWRSPKSRLYPGPGETQGETQGENDGEKYGESSGLAARGKHHRPGQYKKSFNGKPAPRVSLFTFRGSNCEEETSRAFEREGGLCKTLLFRDRCGGAYGESLELFARALEETNILVLPGGFSAGDEPDGSAKYIASVLSSPRLAEAVSRFLQDRDGLILGICNGFQALVRCGLLPEGKIRPRSEGDAVLAQNRIGRHVSRYCTTRVDSKLGPWMALSTPGELYNVPVSHGEGRFQAPDQLIDELEKRDQIAFRYCDGVGAITEKYPDNPNGSLRGIEGILSPDGRILGKMGHSERWGVHLAKNIPAPGLSSIFAAGIASFL